MKKNNFVYHIKPELKNAYKIMIACLTIVDLFVIYFALLIYTAEENTDAINSLLIKILSLFLILVPTWILTSNTNNKKYRPLVLEIFIFILNYYTLSLLMAAVISVISFLVFNDKTPEIINSETSLAMSENNSDTFTTKASTFSTHFLIKYGDNELYSVKIQLKRKVDGIKFNNTLNILNFMNLCEQINNKFGYMCEYALIQIKCYALTCLDIMIFQNHIMQYLLETNKDDFNKIRSDILVELVFCIHKQHPELSKDDITLQYIEYATLLQQEMHMMRVAEFVLSAQNHNEFKICAVNSPIAIHDASEVLQLSVKLQELQESILKLIIEE
ncbi:MAG: hypothetical protein R3Y18_00015 [Bacillota bacterium]